MESLYLLIPLSVAAVFAVGVVLWWAVSGGQFDDLEGPAHALHRLLDDCESETQAAVGSSAAALCLTEAVKDMRQVTGRDPRPARIYPLRSTLQPVPRRSPLPRLVAPGSRGCNDAAGRDHGAEVWRPA